ncbi:hypothetical protein NIES3585_36330 [Nodularia sp. NIES-3585]|nr:hypothetical protein NIES3585_36330 [Nodularia sp. NIES-3585]
MKTKIFGFVLMLGLAAFLGACEPETPPGEAPPAAPAPGEPTDGATPDSAPANP